MRARMKKKPLANKFGGNGTSGDATWNKLTWLVLGGDPAARSHRVEQLTAL